MEFYEHSSLEASLYIVIQRGLCKYIFTGNSALSALCWRLLKIFFANYKDPQLKFWKLIHVWFVQENRKILNRHEGWPQSRVNCIQKTRTRQHCITPKQVRKFVKPQIRNTCTALQCQPKNEPAGVAVTFKVLQTKLYTSRWPVRPKYVVYLNICNKEKRKFQPL
jgi:hypothetical protein